MNHPSNALKRNQLANLPTFFNLPKTNRKRNFHSPRPPQNLPPALDQQYVHTATRKSTSFQPALTVFNLSDVQLFL